MAITDLREHNISELHAMLLRGDMSARELVGASLERIRRYDGTVGAFITVDDAGAMAAAERADEAIAAARSGATSGAAAGAAASAGGGAGADGLPILTGIPVALKDNICTEGIATTAGSKILTGFVPPYSATVAERLTAAGAVIVGKANMDEFAMGSTTESSAFHPTRNPYDTQRVPGGSSGGSVAAVAAGMVCAAVGTDTGGSVRQPSAFCGTVGLKPTYARVSRYGVVGFGSSLDCVGPIAGNVRDCATMLGVMAGHDPKDSTSSPEAVPDYVAAVERGADGVRGVKIGVPREFFADGLDGGVRAAIERTIARLEEAGAEIVEVSIPNVEHSLAVYYLVATAEASSNLARYDGVRYGFRAVGAGDVGSAIAASRTEGFGPEVQRRILLGSHALSAGNYTAYFDKAMRVRTLIRRDIEAVLAECDCFVSPTAPTTALRIGELVEDPLTMYLQDIYTIVANLVGVPALSVPCGLHGGLPVGFQVFGPMFGETMLFRVAAAVEQASAGEMRRPELEVM